MGKKNRKTTEVSYWESFADSMVALLLCVLLIMLLLMLYLVRIDDNDMIDEYLGFSDELYDDPYSGDGNRNDNRIDNEAGDTYDHDDGGGHYGGGYGGGGGYGDGDGDYDFQYEDPDPGKGEGEGLDRAAVFVQVMDGETERTIKREGVTFELYGRDALLQTLSTYYPKKITYEQYKTDANGVFYLPERVVLDTYYLNCLTAIPGYDTGENTYFEIDQAYDWDDPFVVNVLLYPSKNVIELHLKDSADGRPVEGASFQVVAAENITTADGTLRYQENSVVDVITIGADGTGRSQELYLGNYLLQQVTVPEYYGKMEKTEAVSLKSRSSTKQQAVVNLYAEKTTVEVTAVDALYDTKVLPGVTFTLRSNDGAILGRYTTDEQGRFTISSLKKNANYRIRQETAPEGYQKPLEDGVVRVTGDGYINGEAFASMKMKSRITRISVGVQDKLLRNLVSDINLALVDMNGNVVRNWSSTGIEQIVEGLDCGEYQLVMGGDLESAVTIQVQDLEEIQQFRLDRWTTADLALMISAGALGIGLVFLLFWLLKNKTKKKGSDNSNG